MKAHSKIMEPSNSYAQAWGALSFVLYLAKWYAYFSAQKSLVFVNSLTKAVAVFPFYTRFADGYYREKVKKIMQIKAKNASFLTLSVDPKNFSSLMDAHKGLMEGWHKVLSAWRHNKLKIEGWTGEFFWAVEFQKSGNPHLHLLLVGARWVDVDWLRGLWDTRYGVGTFIKAVQVKNDKRLVLKYLTFYMNKAGESFTHLSLLWALSGHAYGNSRGIFNKTVEELQQSPPPNGQWFLASSSIPLEISRSWFKLEDCGSYRPFLAGGGG
jgi:hypothetical protein